jgi:hypothetical protein
VATLDKGLKFTHKPRLHTRKRAASGKMSAADALDALAERTTKLPTNGYTVHLLAEEGRVNVGEWQSSLLRPHLRSDPEAAGPTAAWPHPTAHSRGCVAPAARRRTSPVWRSPIPPRPPAFLGASLRALTFPHPPPPPPPPAAVCANGYGGTLAGAHSTSAGCLMCPAGQYAKQLSLQTACASCGAVAGNAYSPEAGAATCFTCPGSSLANAAANACQGERCARAAAQGMTVGPPAGGPAGVRAVGGCEIGTAPLPCHLALPCLRSRSRRRRPRSPSLPTPQAARRRAATASRT